MADRRNRLVLLEKVTNEIDRFIVDAEGVWVKDSPVNGTSAIAG